MKDLADFANFKLFIMLFDVICSESKISELDFDDVITLSLFEGLAEYVLPRDPQNHNMTLSITYY